MAWLQDLADCEIIMRFALTKPGGGVVFLKNEKPVYFYLSLPANIQETSYKSFRWEFENSSHTFKYLRRWKCRRIFRLINFLMLLNSPPVFVQTLNTRNNIQKLTGWFRVVFRKKLYCVFWQCIVVMHGSRLYLRTLQSSYKSIPKIAVGWQINHCVLILKTWNSHFTLKCKLFQSFTFVFNNNVYLFREYL